MDDLALATRFLAAFTAGDADAVLDLVHPDVRVYRAGAQPWAGTSVGRDGLVEHLARYRRQIDPVAGPGRMLTAGSTVVRLGRARGVVRATGRRFDTADHQVVHVADGLVVAVESFVDGDELRAALAPELAAA